MRRTTAVKRKKSKKKTSLPTENEGSHQGLQKKGSRGGIIPRPQEAEKMNELVSKGEGKKKVTRGSFNRQV